MPRSVADAIRRSLVTMPNVLPLVAAHEIELMLRVSRQRVSQLASDPEFPAPVAVLKVGRIWLREDIEKWALETGRAVYAIEGETPSL